MRTSKWAPPDWFTTAMAYVIVGGALAVFVVFVAWLIRAMIGGC